MSGAAYTYHTPQTAPLATFESAYAAAEVGAIFTNTAFDCDAEWSAWRAGFPDKVAAYTSSAEETLRRGIFCDTLHDIAEFNEALEESGETWWKSVNEYSDLTETEFEEQFLGGLPDFSEDNYDLEFSEHIPSNETLSSSVDHRSKLPGIKSQKCNDCWAFSAVASLDFLGGSHAEQWAIDCNSGSSTCASGGWYMDAWDTAKKSGAYSESSYPYKGKDQSCGSGSVITKISSYSKVSGDIESAASGHVLSIALGAGNNFQSYGGGTYTGGCTSMNHAVNVVGYDSSTYLIRNSWGKSWGDSGYMHMEKGNCKFYNVYYPKK